MGAWGSGSFENDGALDWVAELAAADGLGFLQETFAAVIDEGDYLDAYHCERALAAAEVVAALQGAPGAGLPDEAAARVEAHRNADIAPLVATALRAIDRVRSESELQELWAEDEDMLAEWEAAVEALVGRLRKS